MVTNTTDHVLKSNRNKIQNTLQETLIMHCLKSQFKIDSRVFTHFLDCTQLNNKTIVCLIYDYTVRVFALITIVTDQILQILLPIGICIKVDQSRPRL